VDTVILVTCTPFYCFCIRGLGVFSGIILFLFLVPSWHHEKIAIILAVGDGGMMRVETGGAGVVMGRG